MKEDESPLQYENSEDSPLDVNELVNIQGHPGGWESLRPSTLHNVYCVLDLSCNLFLILQRTTLL